MELRMKGLGKSMIKGRSGGGLGGGLHGCAETRLPGLPTIDHDQADPVSAHLIGWVAVASMEKDGVMHRDRMKIAGTHTEKSEVRRVLALRQNLETVLAPFGGRHAQHGRMKECVP